MNLTPFLDPVPLLAWEPPDNPAWSFHVRENLGGCYYVVVVAARLTGDELACAYDDTMRSYGDLVLNTVNPYRSRDFAEFDRYHALKDRLRPYYDRVRALKAAGNYATLLEVCREALSIQREMSKVEGEKGHFGAVLQQMGATYVGSIGFFLPYVIEELVATGRVEEARHELASVLECAPRVASEPRVKRAQAICDRGTFRRRDRSAKPEQKGDGGN